MADFTGLFRLKSLSEGDRKKLSNFVKTINLTFKGSIKPFTLKDLDQGKVPNETFERLSKFKIEPIARKIINDAKSVLGKLPSRSEALNKFIGQDVQEADLTDEELGERKGALEEQGQTPRVIDRESIKRKVAETAQGRIPSNTIDIVSDVVADFAINANRMPDIGEALDAFTKRIGVSRQAPIPHSIANFFTNQDVFNTLTNFIIKSTTPPDHTDAIKRIGDIIEGRLSEVKKGAGLDKFLAESKAEQKAERGRFLASREGEIPNIIESRIAPRALAQLNVFGLAGGPDVGGVIASEAGFLQGRLEEIFRAIEADDDAVFGNAAFRLRAVQLDLSEADFAVQIAAERTAVRTEQFQRFKKEEQDIADEFGLSLLAREQDRNLRLRGSEFDILEEGAADDLLTVAATDLAGSAGELTGAVLASGSGKDKSDTSEKPTAAPKLPVRVG